MGGAFDKPKSLDELAEKVQSNFDALARLFPVGSENLAGFFSGTGDPNGAVTASVGAIFRRLDGGAATSIYIKESGSNTNTGWIPK